MVSLWIDSRTFQKNPVITKEMGRSNKYIELPKENVSGNMLLSH